MQPETSNTMLMVKMGKNLFTMLLPFRLAHPVRVVALLDNGDLLAIT
jgi:hypothetical protein